MDIKLDIEVDIEEDIEVDRDLARHSMARGALPNGLDDKFKQRIEALSESEDNRTVNATSAEGFDDRLSVVIGQSLCDKCCDR